MSDLKVIRQTALNYLARREYTVKELHERLGRKNFPVSAIQEVLALLTQEGLLNEQRFIESYVHHRRDKGYGPERIRAELSERGICKELIEEYLNIADNTWLAAIQILWQKRFKGNLPTDFKTRAKQQRFFYYRGFNQNHIASLFTNEE